jgi:radical SAM superfamily enzyme YgiQ (UPF0313 family)
VQDYIEKKDILLIFPPIWETDVPYLSLPQLKAYLIQESFTCNTLDLNLDFWDKLFSREFLKDFYSWISNIEIQQITDLQSNLKYRKLKKLSFNELYNNLKIDNHFRNEIREFLLNYWVSLNRLNFKPDISQIENKQSLFDYHDQFFHSASFSENSQYTSTINSFIENVESNPFDEYYKSISFGFSEFRTIGISIVGINQVIPAFTFAKFIKDKFSHINIVFGGAWVTQLAKKIKKNRDLFKYVDFYVVGEGELPLVNILNNIRLKLSISNPNILFLNSNNDIDGDINFSKYIDINYLPPPKFKIEDLNRYDFVGTLPFQTSRGCSWGKCNFCSYKRLDPNYRENQMVKLEKRILQTIKEYNPSAFSFVDSELSPGRIDTITKIITNNNLTFKWGGFARFDKDLSSTLFNNANNNGLNLLIWGLESGSQKILNKLKKGTLTSIISENLRNAHQAGILNRVCLMYNIIDESEIDFQKTVNFIEANIDFIDSLAFSSFTLEYNSDIYEKYSSLILNPPTEKDELYLGYETIRSNNLDVDKLRTLYVKINNRNYE